MVIRKIGDHLNKKVQVDSKHVMVFLGVVLLLVGLVAFIGYSVTGKITCVSHTASEVKLDSEEFPDSDTVREALDELKTSGGAGGFGEDIPQCITYCLTSEGAYVSLGSDGANSDTCANLGFVATLAYPGSSFCLSEGVLYTKSYTGIYVSNVDSADSADSADRADRADQANTAGLCTVYGYKGLTNQWVNKLGENDCPEGKILKEEGDIYFCCNDLTSEFDFESASLYFSDGENMGLYFATNFLIEDDEFNDFTCEIKNIENGMVFTVGNSRRTAYLYPAKEDDLNDKLDKPGEYTSSIVYYLYILDTSHVLDGLGIDANQVHPDVDEETIKLNLRCDYGNAEGKVGLNIEYVHDIYTYFCDENANSVGGIKATAFAKYLVPFNTDSGNQ